MNQAKLYFNIQNKDLRQQIQACTELSRFSLIEDVDCADWPTRLSQLAPPVAIIELVKFSEQDYQTLNSLKVLDDMDLIIISQGEPNPQLDKLMQIGAIFHYRTPLDIQVLNETLEEINQLYSEKVAKGQRVTTSNLDQFGLLVGSSTPMHRLYRQLRRVAKTEANVLIVGESGAGKELVAQTIHLASQRSQQPFVAINCGALSPDLVASELFGHEKGAFTGANKAHQGVFQQAEGGTLFLDEITEMPIEQQVKLLRVLETGEYRPVGSQGVKQAQVRIVAATNRDPQQAIEQQLLREDLYFRLAHFPLMIPPLREREGDIVGLAKHFIAHRNANEAQHKTIHQAAIDKVASHDWPGNVRELKHTIERAFILADKVISTEHLIFEAPPLETGSSLEEIIPAGVALEEIEKAAIIKTLNVNEGNKTETAQDLGISVKTLYNKLDKYQE